MLVPSQEVSFGPFSMDLASTRLVRDGADLELRPQAFSALRTLIHHSGQYVDYERMIREAWEGVQVSRHTVAVTVGEVKRALRECGSWITYRPKLGYRLEVPRAEALIRTGWHCWRRQTREGLDKALECFEQAACEDGADYRAFHGISFSYLMLGTYGMRPPVAMYQGFLAAHRRAVELTGLTPELRADRAHGLHVFERRIPEAEAGLLQVLQERPKLASVYVRLIMLYATSRRLDQALEVMHAAHAADALWPPLPAAEIFVHLSRRDLDAALATGKEAVDLHPYLPLGRGLYAQALEYSGRIEEALAQYRLAATMSPDLHWLRALEASCLARTGRREAALEILDELQRLRASDYVDAYFMTLLFHALGDADGAFRELERAYRENSATLFLLDADHRMDPLRADPRFGYLRNSVFVAPTASRAATAMERS